MDITLPFKYLRLINKILAIAYLIRERWSLSIHVEWWVQILKTASMLWINHISVPYQSLFQVIEKTKINIWLMGNKQDKKVLLTNNIKHLTKIQHQYFRDNSLKGKCQRCCLMFHISQHGIRYLIPKRNKGTTNWTEAMEYYVWDMEEHFNLHTHKAL